MREASRLSQSYIIAAPSADDCDAQAARLAARAVCSGAEPRPCGKCRDCRKAAAGIHPDIINVRRMTDDKGRPKREIMVDQVRDMAADASILPNEAERKVYVIHEAELMNESAQNAALKLLEEPPAWVVFILCTVNSERLLPTVRSRCTEISSGGEKRMDAAMKKLASDYLKAVAAGDRLRLFCWCTANEGMDVRDASDFVACAGELLTEMLCMREKNPGIDRAEILRLGTVLSRCGAMLQVNTGVKHIFGLLAVESLPTA